MIKQIINFLNKPNLPEKPPLKVTPESELLTVIAPLRRRPNMLFILASSHELARRFSVDAELENRYKEWTLMTAEKGFDGWAACDYVILPSFEDNPDKEKILEILRDSIGPKRVSTYLPELGDFYEDYASLKLPYTKILS